MPVTDCRHFTGYKPCGLNPSCDEGCPRRDTVTTRLLIVHLGALGAVVRSTAWLAPLRRKFPRAHVTWVTDAPAHKLLQGHPAVDRVLTASEGDLLALSALKFDAAFVVDKSLKASGVLARTEADLLFGFAADPRTGAILPATEAAEELWRIGLDDELKFRGNAKSEIQLMTEALELGPWRGDRYWLPLDRAQRASRDQRRDLWSNGGRRPVIGLNTGCSDVIAAKKMTVEGHRALIRRLSAEFDARIVLLGGPEDRVRNQRIAFGLPVVQSPTDAGLRDGYASVAACDVVVTGDSLGMHLAIAAGAYTVAWFGPTCAHEIELYGHGEKILADVACGPCWKRHCDKPVMCYDQVDPGRIVAAVERGMKECRKTQTEALSTSSSRPPSSAISSSASDC